MEFQFNNDVIFTDRLKLRPLTIKDSDDMFDYTSLADSTKYLGWNPHTELEQTVNFIKEVELKYGTMQSEFSWGIELIAENKMIGVVKMFDINYSTKRCEVSYILNPKFQGKGYINEAVSAVIDFAFNTMGFFRVQARCSNDNKASERVMQKSNMLYEGLLKKYWYIKGEHKDVVLYAITR